MSAPQTPPSPPGSPHAGWHEVMAVIDPQNRRLSLMRDSRGDFGVAVDTNPVERKPGLRQEEAVRVLRAVAGLCEYAPRQVPMVTQALFSLRRTTDALGKHMRNPKRIDEALSALRGTLEPAVTHAKKALGGDGEPDPAIRGRLEEGLAPLKGCFSEMNRDIDWIYTVTIGLADLQVATGTLAEAIRERRDLPAPELTRLFHVLFHAKGSFGGMARPEVLASAPKAIGASLDAEGNGLRRGYRDCLRELLASLPADANVVYQKRPLREVAGLFGFGDPWAT